MTGLLAVLLAYLLGSIPFGYLITRFATGQDVRATGSGNIGATNVMRAAGRGLGIATLVLDALKGLLAVWLAEYLTADEIGAGHSTWMALAALAAMLGHVFPVFLKFKGGKAVATFIGAFGYLTPLPLFASLIVFMIVVAMTRHISAGSIMAAGTFPLGVWLILHPPGIVTLVALVSAALIIYRHLDNIDRIRAGNEREFRWRS